MSTELPCEVEDLGDLRAGTPHSIELGYVSGVEWLRGRMIHEVMSRGRGAAERAQDRETAVELHLHPTGTPPDRHQNPGELGNRRAELPPNLIATTPTMLDSRMVRREKEKKKRPDWGVPKGIVLLATPEGWRHSVITMEGGMLCGRLDVPVNTDPQDARAAAARMVTELARDFHDTDVEVSWDPPQEPWSWTAQVTLAAGAKPAPPDADVQTASAGPSGPPVAPQDDQQSVHGQRSR